MKPPASNKKVIPGWRYLTWATLAGSLIVMILRAMRPGPMDLLGYLTIAIFGLLAISSAWSLLRNAGPQR